MSSEQQKIYKGTYGKFLEEINAPPLAHEDEIRVALATNNKKVSLKKLFDAVDAPVSEILNTINKMEDKKVLIITRQNNDEIVELV